MPADDALGGRDLIGIEGLQPVDAAPHFGKQRALGSLTDSRREEVVEFGEHER